MLSKLLDTIDILGVLITADALHTQTAHADYPVTERGALFADRETEPADPARPTGVAAQGRRSDRRHPE